MQSLHYTVCINNVQNCRLWIQSSYCRAVAQNLQLRFQSMSVTAASQRCNPLQLPQLRFQSISVTAASQRCNPLQLPHQGGVQSVTVPQQSVQSITVTTARGVIHYSYCNQGCHLKLLQLAMGTIHYSYGHQGCNLLQLTQLFSPLHLMQLQVHTVQSKSVTPFKGTVYCISVYY